MSYIAWAYLAALYVWVIVDYLNGIETDISFLFVAGKVGVGVMILFELVDLWRKQHERKTRECKTPRC